MINTYPVDIQVRDLEDKLTGHLVKSGFHTVSLGDIHQLDRGYLERRDRREIPTALGLTPDEQWRSAEDYLLYDHPEGTLAYVRPNPHAARIPGVFPFEIHFRTAAPSGFSAQQYFSLAIPQRNLELLRKALNGKGYPSISAIAEMDRINVFQRIEEQLDEVDGNPLSIHLFHSVYVSRKREKKSGNSNKAVEDLARAIGYVIGAVHLFSRKQIAYYEAAANVDEEFADSALVS